MKLYTDKGTGLPFYEVRTASGELDYIQQYDEKNNRGLGLRVTFWNEGDEVCTAHGYAMEDTPGDARTSRWYGKVRVHGPTSSFTQKGLPLIPEIEQVMRNNEKA